MNAKDLGPAEIGTTVHSDTDTDGDAILDDRPYLCAIM